MPRDKKAPPHPVDIFIGKRLRARRMELGWNQSELARAAGITFQQIQKYERAANRVSGSRLQQFADALGVTPAWFFPPADAEAAADAHSLDMAGSRDGSELARLFVGMDAERRASLLSVARALAGPSAGQLAGMLQAA